MNPKIIIAIVIVVIILILAGTGLFIFLRKPAQEIVVPPQQILVNAQEKTIIPAEKPLIDNPLVSIALPKSVVQEKVVIPPVVQEKVAVPPVVQENPINEVYVPEWTTNSEYAQESIPSVGTEPARYICRGTLGDNPALMPGNTIRGSQNCNVFSPTGEQTGSVKDYLRSSWRLKWTPERPANALPAFAERGMTGGFCRVKRGDTYKQGIVMLGGDRLWSPETCMLAGESRTGEPEFEYLGYPEQNPPPTYPDVMPAYQPEWTSDKNNAFISIPGQGKYPPYILCKASPVGAGSEMAGVSWKEIDNCHYGDGPGFAPPTAPAQYLKADPRIMWSKTRPENLIKVGNVMGEPRGVCRTKYNGQYIQAGLQIGSDGVDSCMIGDHQPATEFEYLGY